MKTEVATLQYVDAICSTLHVRTFNSLEGRLIYLYSCFGIFFLKKNQICGIIIEIHDTNLQKNTMIHFKKMLIDTRNY